MNRIVRVTKRDPSFDLDVFLDKHDLQLKIIHDLSQGYSWRWRCFIYHDDLEPNEPQGTSNSSEESAIKDLVFKILKRKTVTIGSKTVRI